MVVKLMQGRRRRRISIALHRLWDFLAPRRFISPGLDPRHPLLLAAAVLLRDGRPPPAVALPDPEVEHVPRRAELASRVPVAPSLHHQWEARRELHVVLDLRQPDQEPASI